MPDVDLPAEVRLEDQVADHRLAGQRQSREEDLQPPTPSDKKGPATAATGTINAHATE